MRFADILLDLAAVAKASRSVASRHLELRGKQIDRYSQTSSIIRSLRYDQGKPQENSSSSQTKPTEEGANDGQQQPPHAGSANSKEHGPKESTTPEAISGRSKFDVRRNVFMSSSPLEDIVAQRPAAPSSDQSAILTQLKEELRRDGKKDHEGAISGVSGNPHEPPPPDINLKVFHTSRGSQLLEGQEDVVGRLRPKEPPPKPSWFADFGHDKPRTPDKHEGGKQSPAISKPSDQGRSRVEDSAVAADMAITSPKSKEPPKPPIEEELAPSPVRSPPVEAEPGKVRQEIPAEPLESQLINTREPDAQQNEGETHIHTSTDALPTAEINGRKGPQTVNPLPNEPSKPTHVLRESKVPATRLSRIWNYGGLAAGMLGGALTEGLSRGFGGGGQGSVMFSASNMERLVAKLSKMRGAALKLGQLMSFQDAKMLPGPIQEVLQRVQDRADYMPAWQRDRVLVASLGPAWRELFGEFEETPIAAASIGQVHRATLKTGEKVAVKIQFPGVADSINSDLDNISMLLMASGMLPKGLYLDKTIDNARTELGWECDYERELACAKRYKELLHPTSKGEKEAETEEEEDVFDVPETYAHASGRHVLTMQFMEGVGVTRAASLTQAQRDWIGTQLLRLCLREIVEFRFMQTDPNWTNFLYDAATGRLALLDFGASRGFPDAFVARYVALLAAAARRDRDAVARLSRRLGYLTGHESRAMLDAHVASILTLAEPFLRDAPDVYDFADQTITERVRDLIPLMVRERLSPPPEETYSLHRKLSGAFLLCARLGSRVRCRELFENALKKADFDVDVRA
ncbi:putative atypical ABC1 ABC1-A protein kinase [Rosellinia necatrix]|uniref:Putative atypical ABC1 ABC1-A protein kinase n=1 Tax=Rosellinia necatrix TaxID=77044 RepID=A0A1S7ULC7_ROSNE|nr:putative atypical ABC1 ABC1-A protein kinase [Rosellinia necatrix]